MLIPLLKEESLRQSEVVVYDPFVVSSRLMLGPSFLYEGSYNLGDEVFDGTFYHEVVPNLPNTAPFTSGTSTPEWNTSLGGYTISGTVRFQNIGSYSRTYGKTDETIMRLGNGSFAFLQVTFPQSTTFSIESCRLVLTAPVFSMASNSELLVAPSIVFEPTTVDAVDGMYSTAETSLVATGYILTAESVDNASGFTAQYADDIDQSLMSGNTSIFATGSLIIETEPISSYEAYSSGSLDASLLKTLSGYSELKSESNLSTESLAVAFVNPAYEPLDFETLQYPTSWPPVYLDTSNIFTVAVPKFGEKVSIAIDSILKPDRRNYTLVIFRANDELLDSQKRIKDTVRRPVLVGGDQSNDIQPYVQPVRNQRTLSQTLGGPYRGYILDTYETQFGYVSPIPWFESLEAKRIAQKMTEINFYGDDSGLQVRVEYNTSSQEFVVTQVDFRIVEGVAQNGKETQLRRILPVRIGSKLLYPIGSYDVPWLMVQPDYNPNPIIRIKGAVPMTLSGASDTVFVAQ
jgi:hypothetical protein